ERGSQFDLLEKVPTTFMWVSPIPEELLEKYNLVQLKCEGNGKIYKDVLVYRNGYKLTELDKMFVDELCKARKEIIEI
ncbi:MAG: LysR family transcriptional regulator, partial [Clostridia bacterium]|nr:LysR family transcriptional regulator [Clostridia bacterium]